MICLMALPRKDHWLQAMISSRQLIQTLFILNYRQSHNFNHTTPLHAPMQSIQMRFHKIDCMHQSQARVKYQSPDVIICRTPISSKLQKIQTPFKDHFKANVLYYLFSKLCSYTVKIVCFTAERKRCPVVAIVRQKQRKFGQC